MHGFVGVGVGLVLIAIGSGGLKATATTVVGTLYAPDDVRRDAGFSLFYLGINLGAFAGPLLTGLLQSSAGFHWGFGLAAVGMAAGLIQYSFGRRALPEAARRVNNPLPHSRYPLMIGVALAAIAVVVVLVLTGVIRADNLSLIMIVAVVIAAVAYFAVILSSRQISSDERSRVWGFLPLFLTSVAALWSMLGSKQPPTAVKFSLAAIVMGTAFLLFLPFAGGGPNSTPLLAIVGILFVFTVAELLLSPVGLSVATKLAPDAFRTQMVALFFLSVSLGTAISGELATLYNPDDEVPYFLSLGLIAIAVGVLLMVFSRPVLRLMRGVR